jgi:hypothetical protein
MWTNKSFFSRSSAEAVVPVVHRRDHAVRAARVDAQAERTEGRCLWTHRGEHRAVWCHISFTPTAVVRTRMPGVVGGVALRSDDLAVASVAYERHEADLPG